jgi:MFS transporter, AAHS family, 3-hydroxyphenylpropionic acid transporter
MPPIRKSIRQSSGASSTAHRLAVANVAYPAGHRGIGVGSAIASGRAGSLVGPLAASVMLGAGGSAASVLLALLPVVLLAIATTLALGLRHAPSDGV